MAEADQQRLHRNARLRRGAQFLHRLIETTQDRHDLRLRELRRVCAQLLRIACTELCRTDRAADAHDHQAAEVLCELGEHLLQRAPALQELTELCDQCRRIARSDLSRHAPNPRTADKPQRLLHALRRQRPLRECHTLIENRECVAHPAVRLRGDDAERILLRRNIRFLTDIDETIANFRHRNAVKVIPLAARLDRRGHFVWLRRRENEDHALGRLLQCFKERVKRLRCEHVHFVDDVDLIMPLRWSKLHRLAQIADLVDATVGRCVDLKDIHRRAVADAAAGVTDAARRERRPLGAVQRAREDLCRARLACAARPCKEVGVAGLPARHRAGKRAADMLLPHEIGKTLRPPPPIECNVCHRAPPF